MKRALLVLVSLLGMASAASAVSIVIAPDQASYLPGETVTLTVTVDARGVTAPAAYGRIEYDASILLGGSAIQNGLTSLGGAIEWVLGFLDCGGGTCEAFEQIPGLPLPADQGPDFVLSTMTFTAGAVGSTSIVWTTGGPFDPFSFEFFGLSDAPGTTVVVTPEPATAVLLAAGLVALGARRRARS